jgi:hypothetical protein
VLARLLALAFVCVALVLAPAARAHGMRTALLDVTETSAGTAIARLTLPAATDAVTIDAAAPCTSSPFGDDAPRTRALVLACGATLAGATIGVRGLGPAVSEVIVSVERVDGARASRILTAESPEWTLPSVRSSSAILGDYVRLGMRHIATGTDHLLFLLLLVVFLRRPRAVLLAETAFTLSHALSFTATALEWIHVSAAAAEACIAVSLVLLALDVADARGAHGTRHVKRTAGLAFVFGLVHGLGFAGGLREIGLPDHDALSALVGFAAGVEIAQVAFVVFALALVAIAARARAMRPFALAVAYGAGGLASLWLFQRLGVVLGFYS